MSRDPLDVNAAQLALYDPKTTPSQLQKIYDNFPGLRAQIAGHPQLTPRLLKQLAELNDPLVNAALERAAQNVTREHQWHQRQQSGPPSPNSSISRTSTPATPHTAVPSAPPKPPSSTQRIRASARQTHGRKDDFSYHVSQQYRTSTSRNTTVHSPKKTRGGLAWLVAVPVLIAAVWMFASPQDSEPVDSTGYEFPLDGDTSEILGEGFPDLELTDMERPVPYRTDWVSGPFDGAWLLYSPDWTEIGKSSDGRIWYPKWETDYRLGQAAGKQADAARSTTSSAAATVNSKPVNQTIDRSQTPGFQAGLADYNNGVDDPSKITKLPADTGRVVLSIVDPSWGQAQDVPLEKDLEEDPYRLEIVSDCSEGYALWIRATRLGQDPIGAVKLLGFDCYAYSEGGAQKRFDQLTQAEVLLQTLDFVVLRLDDRLVAYGEDLSGDPLWEAPAGSPDLKPLMLYNPVVLTADGWVDVATGEPPRDLDLKLGSTYTTLSNDYDVYEVDGPESLCGERCLVPGSTLKRVYPEYSFAEVKIPQRSRVTVHNSFLLLESNESGNPAAPFTSLTAIDPHRFESKWALDFSDCPGELADIATSFENDSPDVLPYRFVWRCQDLSAPLQLRSMTDGALITSWPAEGNATTSTQVRVAEKSYEDTEILYLVGKHSIRAFAPFSDTPNEVVAERELDTEAELVTVGNWFLEIEKQDPDTLVAHPISAPSSTSW